MLITNPSELTAMRFSNLGLGQKGLLPMNLRQTYAMKHAGFFCPKVPRPLYQDSNKGYLHELYEACWCGKTNEFCKLRCLGLAANKVGSRKERCCLWHHIKAKDVQLCLHAHHSGTKTTPSSVGKKHGVQPLRSQAPDQTHLLGTKHAL